MKKIAWMIGAVLFVGVWWAWDSPMALSAESRTATFEAFVNVPPRLEFSVRSDEDANFAQSLDGAPQLDLVEAFDFELIQLPNRGVVLSSPIEIELEVISNLGTPFQIVQASQGPLMDSSGNTLSSENFVIQIQGREIPLTDQPQVLITSESSGKSLKVKANYLLKDPSGVSPGVYRTSLVYSVSAF